jgi:hypothetical protein
MAVIREKLQISPEIGHELSRQFGVKPREPRELVEECEENQRVGDLRKIIDVLANYLAWVGFFERDYDYRHEFGEELLWRVRAINGIRMNDLRAILKRKKMFYLRQIEKAYQAAAYRIFEERTVESNRAREMLKRLEAYERDRPYWEK